MSTFPAEPEPASREQAPHVSIVLPCFNEEEHVLLEIERICTAMDKSGLSYELLAISQPRHWLARLGYLYTRHEQARFRRRKNYRVLPYERAWRFASESDAGLCR